MLKLQTELKRERVQTNRANSAGVGASGVESFFKSPTGKDLRGMEEVGEEMVMLYKTVGALRSCACVFDVFSLTCAKCAKCAKYPH